MYRCNCKQGHGHPCRAQDMHLEVVIEDLKAPSDIGQGHSHVPVKAAGPHQRSIQILLHVCGRHDDDPFVGLKAIHLQGAPGQFSYLALAGQYASLMIFALQTGVAVATVVMRHRQAWSPPSAVNSKSILRLCLLHTTLQHGCIALGTRHGRTAS